VKEKRQGKGRHFERLWWQFAWPRQEMRDSLATLDRYIAIGAHGKRMQVAWEDVQTLPSNAMCVFAFEDDFSMGILLSRAHDAWAWARSSTIGTGLRYTPSTAFETFPWPDSVERTQREAVAAASKALYERRSALCLEHDIGLTKLYNLMDDGGFADLRALHKTLDEAVAAAYGWPKSVAQDPKELVARLTDLNRAISLDERPYSPFRATSNSD